MLPDFSGLGTDIADTRCVNSLCHGGCHFFKREYVQEYFESKNLCECRATVGPGRARDTLSNHGPKPDTACDISTSRAVGPARPARFQFHWSSARPRLDSQDRFIDSLFALSRLLFDVSRQKTARLPAPSGCFGEPGAAHKLCTKLSQLYIPVFRYNTVGLRLPFTVHLSCVYHIDYLLSTPREKIIA